MITVGLDGLIKTYSMNEKALLYSHEFKGLGIQQMVILEENWQIFLKTEDKEKAEANKIISLNPIKSMKGITGKLGINKLV